MHFSLVEIRPERSHAQTSPYDRRTLPPRSSIFQTIHVYGPGGPLAPMKECAQLYTKRASLLGTDALEPVAVTSDPRFPSPRLCVHAFVCPRLSPVHAFGQYRFDVPDIEGAFEKEVNLLWRECGHS
jgi:hypothetical protein